LRLELLIIDDVGGAGSAKLSWETGAPGWSGAKLGATGEWRQVEPRFEPFTRLERPFEQEDWGLPAGADLEHQRRAEGSVYFRPSPGGELRGNFGSSKLDQLLLAAEGSDLELYPAPDHPGSWQRADGEQADRKFPKAVASGRAVRSMALLARAFGAGRWDQRWTPSDTGKVGDRYREVGGELRSGSATSWRLQPGYALRRSGALGVQGWSDHDDARTASLGFQSPEPRAWSSSLQWQRHTVQELSGGPPTSSDLASARLRGADARRGLGAVLG
jgi:hypothetical protein